MENHLSQVLIQQSHAEYGESCTHFEQFELFQREHDCYRHGTGKALDLKSVQIFKKSTGKMLYGHVGMLFCFKHGMKKGQ